ncbi:MAG: enoyl-CoA hydratase/isomerase family protein [Propionibacteriaceae bacterium]|jgi:enoyl-CoA hydratase|nr:enoyl-CoA hydratase/isomerase family protein [Propionibacteriaceae bacterium]
MDTEVQFWVRDGIGYIHLNRPRAINALSQAMFYAIESQVTAWLESDEVISLDLSGEGSRGYCAGADIRQMRNLVVEDPALGVGFLDDEYRLDALLAHSPLPLTAHLHGVTMGGGVGLAMRASRRVASTDLQWAMPEVGIGLWPDVGTTYELSRIPGNLGVYMGMTGTTIDAASALYAGVVDEVMETTGEGASSAPREALANPESHSAPSPCAKVAESTIHVPGEVFAHVGKDSAYALNSQLAHDSEWIAQCFTGDNALDIVSRLESHPNERAQATAVTIREKAPLSVAVTLAAVRQAETLPNLDAVFARDSALARTIGIGSDFIEGVRAQLLDKDRTPHWHHARLEEVTPQEVQETLAG